MQTKTSTYKEVEMRLLPSVSLLAALALLTVPAHANIIFNVAGVTTTGGALSGTFTTNDAITSVVSFSITTPAASPFTAFTYSPATATVTASTLPSQYFRLDTAGSVNELQFYFATGLTNAGGTLLSSNSYENQPTGGNRFLSGVVTNVAAIPAAVPEPMSLGLLGAGLAGLGLIRRSKRAA